MVLYSLVISRSGFEAILMIPGTISLVPSVAIAHRPAREMAILVDPPQAKALGDQLRDNPLDFVSWISPAIFP